MLRTRWSPHHRGTLRTLGIPASALCLFLLAGSVASAAPTPNSLHERLTRLNAQADQAVEQYLQAKLALQQTQGSAASLRRRAADARKERDRLSAVIAAQAADTYVNGAGAGLASVLGAEDPNVAFDRMQTLSVQQRPARRPPRGGAGLPAGAGRPHQGPAPAGSRAPPAGHPQGPGPTARRPD